MSELVGQNWWLLAIALVIGLVVAWWLFVARRRTRIDLDRRDTLDEGAERAQRNQALIDAPRKPEGIIAAPPVPPVEVPVAAPPPPPPVKEPEPAPVVAAEPVAAPPPAAKAKPKPATKKTTPAPAKKPAPAPAPAKKAKPAAKKPAPARKPVPTPAVPPPPPAVEEIEQLPPPTPEGLAGIGVAIQAEAAPAPAPHHDLALLKGVGPKLVVMLHQLGVTGFDDIAGWSEADIDRIDAQLEQFQGRIRRDHWVEQARLLAAGDIAGFEAKFGKL